MLSKKGETDNADMSTNEAWPPTPFAAPGKVEKKMGKLKFCDKSKVKK